MTRCCDRQPVLRLGGNWKSCLSLAPLAASDLQRTRAAQSKDNQPHVPRGSVRMQEASQRGKKCRGSQVDGTVEQTTVRPGGGVVCALLKASLGENLPRQILLLLWRASRGPSFSCSLGPAGEVAHIIYLRQVSQVWSLSTWCPSQFWRKFSDAQTHIGAPLLREVQNPFQPKQDFLPTSYFHTPVLQKPTQADTGTPLSKQRRHWGGTSRHETSCLHESPARHTALVLCDLFRRLLMAFTRGSQSISFPSDLDKNAGSQAWPQPVRSATLQMKINGGRFHEAMW